jgi:apoptotic chromatin condensation inducer in the nucleus
VLPGLVSQVEPAKNAVSCTIRVDGFKRPLRVPELKAYLAEKAGADMVEGGFWMDSIKTHCYATFPHSDNATAAREALHNQVWPERGGLLKADFSPHTAEDVKSGRAAPPPAPAPASSAPSGPASGPTPSPRTPAAQQATRSLLSMAIGQTLGTSGSLGSLGSGLKADKENELSTRRKRELGPSPDRVKRSRTEESNSLASKGEDYNSLASGSSRVREGERDRDRDRERSRAPPPPPPVKLDDLFRATKTQPKIYWLPVAEERVAVKRQRKAEAKGKANGRPAADNGFRRGK